MSRTAGRPPTRKALTSTVAGLSIAIFAAIVGILVHQSTSPSDGPDQVQHEWHAAPGSDRT
ncbi:hypothetical protein AB0I53_30305 [Saccharopolyspora sp. NPDC050389]|uniref:hypothetical protein n=1 Tax=Saccharopolyspora sp. NPDC050389 TaxID=3155516 RepID=UPI003411E79A